MRKVVLKAQIAELVEPKFRFRLREGQYFTDNLFERFSLQVASAYLTEETALDGI